MNTFSLLLIFFQLFVLHFSNSEPDPDTHLHVYLPPETEQQKGILWANVLVHHVFLFKEQLPNPETTQMPLTMLTPTLSRTPRQDQLCHQVVQQSPQAMMNKWAGSTVEVTRHAHVQDVQMAMGNSKYCKIKFVTPFR